MMSSPCRNCDKRHLPKDKCMKDCKKIAAFQQSQNMMHTPPYAYDDGSDTFDCLYKLSFVGVSDEVG